MSSVIGRNKVLASTTTPVMQYANGRTEGRLVGSSRFTSQVGFHIEQGSDPALDEAAQRAGLGEMDIRHTREGGTEIVRHWWLGESVAFFPVTSGPFTSSLVGLVRFPQRTANAGLGARWGQEERSKLALHGFVLPLWKEGYTLPILFSARSRMTDVLLGALVQHTAICEAADAIVDREKHPSEVGLWELAMVLEPGEEETWGKKESTTVTPFRLNVPPVVNRESIIPRWRPVEMEAQVERVWPSIVEWAASYCTAVASSAE